ncbi:hypothetical protein ACHWQZ_G015537 [Mnemiopsis leidyi]
MKLQNPLTYKRPKPHNAAKILYTNQIKSKRIMNWTGGIVGFVIVTYLVSSFRQKRQLRNLAELEQDYGYLEETAPSNETA